MKISSTEFLNLGHPIDTHRWEVPITADLTGGRGSLFGGAGLAAGIVALEQATDKPVIWATGQYLSIVQQPVTLELEVTLPAVGRNVSQGRVVGHLGDREIITIIGAVGERSDQAAGMWLDCPHADSPDNCETLNRQHETATMHDHVEIRMARGMFGFSGAGTPSGDGRSLLWARMPKVEHDAGALALLRTICRLFWAMRSVRSCIAPVLIIRFATQIDRRQNGCCVRIIWSLLATALAMALCICGVKRVFYWQLQINQ